MRSQLLLSLISVQVLLAACNQSRFQRNEASRTAPEPIVAPTFPVTQAPVTPVPNSETKDLIAEKGDFKPVTPTPAPAPLPAPLPAPVPVPVPDVNPPSKAIEFGATEIFRIGDGYTDVSAACAGQVKTYNLSGTTYFFQFEVLDDNTKVELTIGRICGVDKPTMDTFALRNEQTKAIVLAERPMPQRTEAQQGTPWAPYPKFTLAKGTYSVVITSKNTLGKPKVPGVPIDPSKDEYDDFLVGNILLKADQNVKYLKIYTE